jgi:hypothetical protein
MFDYYNEQGNLYININKKTNRKYQFHFNGSDSQFMDEKDKEITKPIPQKIGMSDGLLYFYQNLGNEDDLNYDFNYLYYDQYHSIDDDGITIEQPKMAIVDLNEYRSKYYLFTNEDNQVKPLTSLIEPVIDVNAQNGLLAIQNVDDTIGSYHAIGVYDIENYKFLIPFAYGDYNGIKRGSPYWILYGSYFTIIDTRTKKVTLNVETKNLLNDRNINDYYISIMGTDFGLLYLSGQQGYSVINKKTGEISEPIVDPTYYKGGPDFLETNDINGNSIKINKKTGEITEI